MRTIQPLTVRLSGGYVAAHLTNPLVVAHEFDPDPVAELYVSLARDYPGPEVYPTGATAA